MTHNINELSNTTATESEDGAHAEPAAGTSIAATSTLLYGDFAGPFLVELDGVLLDTPTVADIPDGARPLPYNEAGLFFRVDYKEDVERDDYLKCSLKPTLVYYHEERKAQIRVWALKEPVQLEGPWENLPELFGMDINVGVPLDGDDGWAVVYSGIDRYAPGELLAARPPDDKTPDDKTPVEVEPEQTSDPNKFLHADIKTPFDPDAEAYKQLIKIMMGKNSKSTDWKPVEMPVVNLLAMLSQHEVGAKDGVSVVYAEMIEGRRLKSEVISVTSIGLDFDTGEPPELIDNEFAKLNCTGVRYSTHSSGRTQSEWKRAEILKFDPTAEEVDTDLVHRYLLQKRHAYPPLVETVEIVEIDGDGMVKLKHGKWFKNRLVIPLQHPYVIKDEGTTEMEAAQKWAKYPEALAALLKLPFDTSCTDTARIFYPPRHPKGGKHNTSASVFGGPLFDLKTLNIEEQSEPKNGAAKPEGSKSSGARSGKSGTKGNPSKTDAGIPLAGWWKDHADRLQITDIIQEYCPDRIISRASAGYNIACPFKNGHHNADDQNDAACFAINAGEGTNETFVVKCQHASCAEYSKTDYLGRMLEDHWFPREAIGGSTGDGPDPGQKAVRDKIMSDIGELDPKSPNNSENAKALAKRIFDAKGDSSWTLDAKNKLASRSGLGKTEINDIYERLKPKQVKADQTQKAQSKNEIAVCERLGCTALYYPHNFVEIILNVFDGRPYLFEKHDNFSVLLCSPTILACSVEYADRDQECGKRVKFLNGAGECIEMDFPNRLLVQNSGKGILEELYAWGWYGGKKGEDFILEYLKHAHAPSVTIHDNGGWKPAGYLFRSGVNVPEGAVLEISADAGLIGPDANIGTLDGALAATKKLFIANPKLEPLQFCYLAGLAGPVVSAAKDKPLQYAPEGPTSCGKTTGAEFGLSHYGDCRENNDEKKQGGMLYTANSTLNAFALMLKRSSGGALGIDDFNQQPAAVQQKAVFMGHAMTDKIRMNKDSTEKPTPSWGPGVIFYMGEIGMSQRLSQENVTQLGGLSVRVFPITFNEDNKIKDPKDWDPIENLIRNFGHIGPAFVSAMIAQKWHNDPLRIENVIKKLVKMLLGPEDFADVQKRRAGRMVAYPLFVAMLGKRAGIIPKDFDAVVLCRSLWRKFLESDLAPVQPAKKGIDILLNRLMGTRCGEVRHIDHGGDGDGDNSKVGNRGEAFAYYGAWTTICPADGPKQDGKPVPVPLAVYVIRADKIAEMAGGAMDKKSLLGELENQGYVVRNPKTPLQRTWNNFPKLGQVQYVVLRADKIDAS